MNLLLTIASLDLSSGGPSENIPKLAEELSRQGIDVGVLCAQPGEVHSIFKQGHIRLFVPPSSWCGVVAYPTFASHVIRDFDVDIIHDNGIWLPQNHVIGRAARLARKKLLISPRGMLEPWSIRHKAIKKKIAWNLYQRRDLMRADKLVATAEDERQNILDLLPDSDVAIVPNGWESPMFGVVSAAVPRGSRLRKVLFFSRIHSKKGIELLIEAWAVLRPRNWQLDIVGPGNDTYISRLRQKATNLMTEGEVRFLPPVYGNNEKNKVLGAADVVILPSYSENFGSVVVEAMGLGVPIITTTGTPWREVAEAGAGWWVEPSTEGILHALTEAVGLNDEERHAMGCRARQLVLERYTWESVAKRMIEVYEQTLSK